MAVADINGDGYDDISNSEPEQRIIVYANMNNGVFNGWVGVTGTRPVGK